MYYKRMTAVSKYIIEMLQRQMDKVEGHCRLDLSPNF